MAKRPLKILYVGSELSPLVSTGGLADVAAALPRALHALGHDVRLALPGYDAIPPQYRGDHHCLCVVNLAGKTYYGGLRRSYVPATDIPLYLIEQHEFFSRGAPYGIGAYEFEDNAKRFSFFGLAAIDGVSQLQWKPDIVHCHDWHSAGIPAYLRTRPLRDPSWRDMPTLFTIHNLNYQGRYPASKLAETGLPPELFHPACLEYYGDINLMKAGIAFASKLSTVSPRYAKEIQTLEFGAGLDGFLKTRAKDLTGILNGVDYTVWNPATDTHIAAHYSADDLSGKAVCKKALQAAYGLPERDVPLFGTVLRISWQKGVDILLAAMDRLMQRDIQLVILGAGDPAYEQACREAARRHPGKVGVITRFDVPISHRIEAGCDFFLMPSRYEPCGLSQMYSLAYGAIPIVNLTGGLADSVCDCTPANLAKDRATGLVFTPCTPEVIVENVDRALCLYGDPEMLHRVRLAGMRQDFSWERAAKEYVRLYRKAIANP